MPNIFQTERPTNIKVGWYTDGARRPASSTRAVISKVKVQGRKVSWHVWQVLVDKTRTKRPRNTKIGCNVVRPTGNSAHQFEGQRSKIKDTRPTNAETGSASYLPSGKAYELQTWYTDGTRRPALATSAETSKIKGQGRKVTWRVWQVLAD